jgi:ankyrin repeat protein
LRALALRRCHSVGSHGALPSVLAHVQRLQVLVCTGYVLSDAAISALGKLAGLRVLCIAECTVHGNALLSCLPGLGALRCLLLGGARLLCLSEHRDSTGRGDAQDGLLSLDPVLDPPSDLLPGTDRASMPSAYGSLARAQCSSLACIEWTFLQAAARKAVLAVAPLDVFTLDLCSSSSCALQADLVRVRAVLDHVCEPSVRSVAETALSASLSARCAGFHETALHHAAIEGDASAAELLIRHGALVDVKDAKGCTPLARAIFWGHPQVCQLLLSTNACDLDVCNHAAESPAYLAALRGHADCLKLLLEAGGNFKVAPADDASEAHTVAFGRYAASREYHDGYTPLHAAVISRSIPCIQLLLQYGFAPSAQNRYQQTALHIAASLGSPPEVIQLLVSAGCPASLKDERGHTALQVARSKGHEHIATCLAEYGDASDSNSPQSSSSRTHGRRSRGGRGRSRRGRGGGRGVSAGTGTGGSAHGHAPHEASAEVVPDVS